MIINRILNKNALLILALLFHSSVYANDNMRKVGILYSEDLRLHDTGPAHPENYSRIELVIEELHADNRFQDHLIWPSLEPANNRQIEMVHSENYINLVENEISNLKTGEFRQLSTGDTILSEGSLKAAKLAVGAGIRAADEIMSGKISAAVAIIRPPGHHVSKDRGMGFGIYNSVAITARYLQQRYGVKRILIADFDVHHGNGTQDIFYTDNSVFYFSVHQHPLYPGTGRPSETGLGIGEGYTLNVDLPAGAGDIDLTKAFKEKLIPAMKQFKPDFVLVSAGFDGHKGDLLGSLAYTHMGYKNVSAILNAMANQYSSDRIIYMLEGGYHPQYISNSLKEIIAELIQP